MKSYSLVLKLLTGLALGIVVGLFAPDWAIRVTETGRVLLGTLIQFFIPLIIFTFVAAGIAELKTRAGKMLGFSVGLAYLDTVLACALAAVASYLVLPWFGIEMLDPAAAAEIGAPFVEIEVPPVMSILGALALAFIFGIGSTWGKAPALTQVLLESRDIISRMVSGFVIPLIPVFIFFVFAGLAAEGEVFGTIAVFGQMLILILVLQLVWLAIEYSVAGAVTKQNPVPMVKALLPAYVTAMGTMSSAATMPVSTKGAGTVPYMKKRIADFAMPLFATVHLSGAAMTITISAATVTMLTTGELPSVGLLVTFIILLGIIEVGAAGVPGGSVLAAIGILQSTLGFDETAVGLMLALFMIQDSFGTAANITGDGALAMMVNKVFGRGLGTDPEADEDLEPAERALA